MFHFINSIFCLLLFLVLGCSSVSETKEAPAPSPSSKTVIKEEASSDSKKSSKVKKKDDKSYAFPKESDSASGVSDSGGEGYGGIEKTGGTSSKKKSSESGLKAGFSDDNKQFNYFQNFLEKFKPDANHLELNTKERIWFQVKDANGKFLPNTKVKIKSGFKTLSEGLTYSDGTYLFFPSEYKDEYKFNAVFQKNKASKEISFDRQGSRKQIIQLDSQEIENYPLDIVFVLDTTGSMGEEIARLKNTIEIINLNLGGDKNGQVRFGMVLYRDKGEEYRTKVIGLTNDLNAFKKELDKVSAGGGGDVPEDLQEALKDSIEDINWNEKAIKLSFVITDAAPHLDYGQSYDYVKTSKKAREKGIKIFTIGTGGLDINGEYVLRQISQYTYAKYIFLTYGEKGESDGGKSGSVSHHTGDNFPTDKLESIIIRFAKEEMANSKSKPLESSEEYFSASKISNEKREETLSKLYEKAISQLIDYSSFSLKEGTTLAILPYSYEDKKIQKSAEYFLEQSLLSFLKNKTFKVVERKDLQKVLLEQKLNLQAIDEKNAVKVGELLGAKLLAVGKMYQKENNFEIYLKLVNSETGEIQAATKLIIEKKLGL